MRSVAVHGVDDGLVATSWSLLVHAATGLAIVYLVGCMIAGAAYLAIGGQIAVAATCVTISFGWAMLMRQSDAGNQAATVAMISWIVLGTALGVGRHAWKDWHRV